MFRIFQNCAEIEMLNIPKDLTILKSVNNFGEPPRLGVWKFWKFRKSENCENSESPEMLKILQILKILKIVESYLGSPHV